MKRVLFLALWAIPAASCGGESTVAGPAKADVADVAADVAESADTAAQPDQATVDAAPDTAQPDSAADLGPDAPAANCTCGDGVCNGAANCLESLATCPTDCATCGDKVCSPGESPKKCKEDCCAGGCGDGICKGYECGEDPTTCAQDCGGACGNGSCDKGENPTNCADDCKKQACGNGVCEPEDGGPKLCPDDCKAGCGNCVCDKGEDYTNCPVDCGYCGDGYCSQCLGIGESVATCAADCKANGCGEGCDDKIACTTDLCGSDGNCTHVTDATACNDKDVCTDDTCSAKDGCVHSANLANCDDGDACTTGDVCAAKLCAGTPKPCGDGNVCTDDSCAASGDCVNAPAAATCADDNVCTVGDGCKAGKCVSGALDGCDDGNDCTNDACNPQSGCSHTANLANCDDLDPCSVGDYCKATVCKGQAKDCNDNLPCTVDSCVAATGVCIHPPSDGACTDDNVCTVGDACVLGKCVPGAVNDCNDQDDCTADSCDVLLGCQHTPTACKACTPDEACVPTNTCHLGTTTCVNKKPICNDTLENAPDDTLCGNGVDKGCLAGICTSFSNIATITVGDGQQGARDKLLGAVTVKVTDAKLAAQMGVTVTVTPPPGAVAVPASGKTNLQGKFTFTPRLGRALGAYAFTVKAVSAAPVTVQATATEVEAGKIFTLLNTDHSSGNDGVPGPATAAHVGVLGDFALASDGTIYQTLANQHRVIRIDPAGVATLIAGTGTAGYSGDGDLAINAKMNYPHGIALDEATGTLYVGELGNDRIRLIDLPSGMIDTFAGAGTAPGPGYGDSNPANAAVIDNPTHVFKGPDNALYVADTGHGRIRRIDLESSVITPWGPVAGNNCGGDELQLYNCGSGLPGYGAGGACAIAWDAAGSAFISANFCGGIAGSSVVMGIVKRAPDGKLSYLAGKYNGAVGYGGPAKQAEFATIESLAVDKAGNLYGTNLSSSAIWRIEHASGRVTQVIGTGTSGYDGDYVPASVAQVGEPRGLTMDANQNLYFADATTYTLREVVAFGQLSSKPAVLSAVSGGGQSLLVDQPLSAPFVVKLVDDTGAPLVGYPVSFTILTDGAGLYSNGGATGTAGTVSTIARLGLQPGDYKIQASFQDLDGADVAGSPVLFTATATAPAAGTIFTAVNGDHSSANDGQADSAAMGHIGAPVDMAVVRVGTFLPVGTTFIADPSYNRVYRITPGGKMSTYAGTGWGGYTGDNGPATEAKLYQPTGVAYDDTSGVLYIADRSNSVVRAVDKGGVITTFAGGGTAPSPGYGDSGPASAAVFASPHHVYLGPDNALYVADGGHSRIRRIDLGSNIIAPWVGSSTSAPCTADIELWGCSSGGWGGGYSACSVAWDKGGNAYIGGTLCGIKAPSGQPYGIMKRTPEGVLSWVGGKYNGSTADGIDVKLADLGRLTAMQVDDVGNLYFVETNVFRVRKIDVSGVVTTVSGNLTSAYFGEYVQAALAQFVQPWGLLLMPGGHIAVTDVGASCLRYIW